MCIDIVRHLRDAISRKRPEKWRYNSWFLLYDHAPAHRRVWVKDFLVKYNTTTPEHPPYPRDLSSAYFYLFSRLKLALKGERFCGATDIIKNATGMLKRLTKWLPGMFSTPLESLAEVSSCTRGLF